ncbi:hypothetical protein BDK89_2395 [Ilumatobacter fluminis]|uniref:Uncharacterized protein n=1 Tax=Ilumatobacter fluminis TaxID=467091 RepID=A0A4R7HZV5_9ACTN|nr:hypothetical protein BDK89_2395 [Ilumatobacter fluminis]
MTPRRLTAPERLEATTSTSATSRRPETAFPHQPDLGGSRCANRNERPENPCSRPGAPISAALFRHLGLRSPRTRRRPNSLLPSTHPANPPSSTTEHSTTHDLGGSRPTSRTQITENPPATELAASEHTPCQPTIQHHRALDPPISAALVRHPGLTSREPRIPAQRTVLGGSRPTSRTHITENPGTRLNAQFSGALVRYAGLRSPRTAGLRTGAPECLPLQVVGGCSPELEHSNIVH